MAAADPPVAPVAPVAMPIIATATVLTFRKPDLVSALEDRGLDATGNMLALRTRLFDAMHPVPPAGGAANEANQAAVADGNDDDAEGDGKDAGGKNDQQDEDEVKDDAADDPDNDYEWSLATIHAMDVHVLKTELARRRAATTGSIPALRARLIKLTADGRLRHRVNKIQPNGNARTATLLVPSSVSTASSRWWDEDNPFFKNAHQLRTAWDTAASFEVSLQGGTLQSTKKSRPGFPNMATIERLNLEMCSRGDCPESWRQLVRSARYLTDAPYRLTDEALQHWTCMMALHCRASHEAGNPNPELPEEPASPKIMERVKAAFAHTSYSRESNHSQPAPRKSSTSQSAPRKTQRPTATCLFCPGAPRPHATDDCRSLSAQRARKFARTAKTQQSRKPL